MPKMLRPKAQVLPDGALVPPANLKPPPKQFTHQVVAEQPFYFDAQQADGAAPGRFAPGTRLLMLEHDGGPLCRVQDGRGLCVVTPVAGLRTLP